MSLLDHPVQLIVFLFLLSILPLLVVLGTSFLKISIVLALLRNALGIQHVPPNLALYAISLVLTAYVMAPVGFQVSDALKTHPVEFSSPESVSQVDDGVLAPYRAFLKRHTPPRQIHFFVDIGQRTWPEQYKDRLDVNSLLVLMPAFAIGQLIEAFKMGLLIFLPFIAIDLIVSIILLSLGMMMVSPLTIALPFKLLLFVLMGGWEKLLSQLMLSYS
jgi:type III secretion protein R